MALDSGNGRAIPPLTQELPLTSLFFLIPHPVNDHILLILPLTSFSNPPTSLHPHCHHPPLSHYLYLLEDCNSPVAGLPPIPFLPVYSDIRDIFKNVCDLWFFTALLKITKVANAQPGHSLTLYHWVSVIRGFFLLPKLPNPESLKIFSYTVFSAWKILLHQVSSYMVSRTVEGPQDSHPASVHVLNNHLFLSVGYEGISLLWLGY